jgi:membrane peptidoglycan carboxypeptidase
VAGKPNPWLVVFKLVGTLVATGVLGAGLLLPVVGGIGLAVDDQAKHFLDAKCTLSETQPPRQTMLYANDGKTLLARIFEQDRQPVKYDAIPDFLRKALIATEDRRFYSHHGVDMRGLIRGFVNTTSGDTQGGSTLTMQYVKQIRYYQAGKDIKAQEAAIAQNLHRKIEDAKCALNLEQHESKQDILTNYLNIAFFGENSYGIETAAETYFNHTTSELTLPEAAMLVGLLRAPTQYDPFQYPEAARERRNEVLQNLVDVGDLSQTEANKYAATPVSLATTKPPEVREGCSNAPDTVRNVGFFCQYAVNWLLDTHTLTESQLKSGGYNIVTTLNAKLQDRVQASLASTMPATSPMTAVLPVIDPHSGNVLAMASSKKFGQATSDKDNTHTTLPIFTSYAAQAASTYKLFPLLTALSTGVPDSWPLQNPTSSSGYRTRNCVTESTAKNGDANEYYPFGANETLDSATVKSSNTFFVGLADQLFQCNLNPMVDMATKLGMKGLLQPSDTKHQNIAQVVENLGRAQQFVLGDVGTSPLELTSAYAAVANQGKYNAPAPIVRITDYSGEHTVRVPRSPEVQAVAPQVALQAVQILKGDTDAFPGTSASQFQSWYAAGGSAVAGKTGTGPVTDSHGRETDQNGALWFVGMTPNLVATSALINFDRTSAPAAGLPGVSDPSHNAYGAYAAGVWLKALRSSLGAWTWPDPDAVPGNEVDDVVGQPVPDAVAQLKDQGYKVAVLGGENGGLLCASTQPLGTVAFYGPQRAEKGATITLCGSVGTPQDIYVKPTPTPHPSTSQSTSGSSAGGGSSSNQGPRPTQTAITHPHPPHSSHPRRP